MDKSKIIKVELEFERAVSQSRELSLFRRNPTTWELLLLAQNENGALNGLYKTIDAVETKYLGNSALLKFVREQRDHGTLHFLEAEKKSKWVLQVEQRLIDELVALLLLEAKETHLGPGRPFSEGWIQDIEPSDDTRSMNTCLPRRFSNAA